MTAPDEIRFTVPASPFYLRLTRLLAAGVASRAGFRLEEIDDLRIAIDEVCHALVGEEGREGTVTVIYRATADEVTVEGEGRFAGGMGRQPLLSPLSSQILAAVVDHCDFDAGTDGPTFRIRKLRRGSQ